MLRRRRHPGVIREFPLTFTLYLDVIQPELFQKGNRELVLVTYLVHLFPKYA
jgi:hypothetical protein